MDGQISQKRSKINFDRQILKGLVFGKLYNYSVSTVANALSSITFLKPGGLKKYIIYKIIEYINIFLVIHPYYFFKNQIDFV